MSKIFIDKGVMKKAKRKITQTEIISVRNFLR